MYFFSLKYLSPGWRNPLGSSVPVRTSTMVYACSPSTRKKRLEDSWGSLASQTSLNTQVPGPSERPCFKKQSGWLPRSNSCGWPMASIRMHTHAHAYSHKISFKNLSPLDMLLLYFFHGHQNVHSTRGVTSLLVQCIWYTVDINTYLPSE